MKTKMLLLLTLLACGVASAQTLEVSGIQSGVWNADTVRVTGDVTVVGSLEILPGTLVLFSDFSGIWVDKDASLMALGTEADSIVFTVADTTGFSSYNNFKGSWNGFRLDKAGKVVFDYCVLQYAKASDTLDMSGGVMRITDCDDVAIGHSTLRCNGAREHGGAIYATHSHVVMTDCSVNDNRVFIDDPIYARYGGALCFQWCDVELRGMEFLRNRGEVCIGGALSLDSCSVVLDRAVFADNIGINGGGLYMMRSNHLPGRLSNLLFDHNFSHHFAGGIAFADSSPEVYNMLVTNNDSEGVNCSGIFFYQYCSPKLTNCIVYGNYPSQDEYIRDTAQMWLWTFEEYAPEFRNCLIEGGYRHITNSEYIKVYEDILEGDPLFVDFENHDFRLSEASPCRDAGHPELPEDLAEGFDLVGIRRVSNQRVDIGPYEYSGASVPVHPSVAPQARLVGNPLGEGSRIEFVQPVTGEVMVTAYELTGRRTAQEAYVLGSSTCLEIGGMAEKLPSGVYLIEVSVANQTFVLKAVK